MGLAQDGTTKTIITLEDSDWFEEAIQQADQTTVKHCMFCCILM